MEREFLRWLSESNRSRSLPPSLLVGIGDDGAVLNAGSEAWVVTTDSIAEGTHFLRNDDSEFELRRIGRKLVAVNLSDLAAMGARPVAVTLNFQLPQELGLDQACYLFDGAAEMAESAGARIVGGDTNRWTGPLVLAATALGTRPADRRGWGLPDGRAGDVILVSGALGGSRRGRHLDFEPRVALSNFLTAHYTIGAATDISDSLTIDLHAIAVASGVQAVLDLASIPISPDVELLLNDADCPAAQRSAARLRHALEDGEDFELLITVAARVADALLNDHRLPTPLTRIGHLQAGTAGLVDPAGQSISVRGYDH